MLRFRSNCSVTDVLPKVLIDVICDRPAIWANCRSRGAATDDAIVVGSAPGRAAPTETVGKSTLGSAASGSWLNPMMPASRIAAMISEVAIGRSMKVLEKLIGPQL